MRRIKQLMILPPVAALLAVGTGLGMQRNSIQTLTKENQVLLSEIQHVRQGGESDSSSTEAAKTTSKGGTPVKRINWKNLVARIGTGHDDPGSQQFREMLMLQKSLQAMSADELTGALDEIAALDLPDQVRQELEGALVDMLAQKDPKLLFDRFSDRVQDENGRMAWSLSNAYQEWSKKDTAAAMAWLDHQIQSGKFESKSLDGQNRTLSRYEAALVGALLSRDPAAAQQRAASIPEKDRAHFFASLSINEIKPGSEKAFADLFRNNLPAREQAERLGTATQALAHRGGYERVGKFLGQIEATENERKEIVTRAIQAKMSQYGKGDDLTANIEQARNWATQQSPSNVDQITGTTLGRAAEVNFEESSKLALQYHDTTGNDEILVSFLLNRSMKPTDPLEPLVDRIKDPQRREDLRKLIKRKKGQ